MSNVLGLQKGVRAVLVANATVTGLVGQRVYDEPPQDPTYPFVRFGPVEEETYDTDNTQAVNVTQDIEVWSRPKSGREECQKIIDAVRSALHRKESTITVDGSGTLVLLRCRDNRVERSPDGRTYFGQLIFEAMIDGGR